MDLKICSRTNSSNDKIHIIKKYLSKQRFYSTEPI